MSNQNEPEEPKTPEPEVHTLRLASQLIGGWEEYYCDICGRHFIMRFPPGYARYNLAEGDGNVQHNFGKGGLQFDAQAMSAEDYQTKKDEEYLDVFEKFLKKKEDDANDTT